MPNSFDVLVAGSGNAALTAAASAAQSGARVLVLEKAPFDWMGGNSRFTGGVFRAAYEGLADLADVVSSGPGEGDQKVTNRSYPADHYYRDVMDLTGGYADAALTKVYVEKSLETLRWMVKLGVEFMLAGPDPYGSVNPGAAIWVRGAGRALVPRLHEVCTKLGVEFKFDTQVIEVLTDAGSVTGLRCRTGLSETAEFFAPRTILASGGFEASSKLRAAFLGPEWDSVRVRGSRYNTGDLLPSLAAIGAQMSGGWSDCHATPVSAEAPMVGNDHAQAENFARHDFSYGIMVNSAGQRFMDEGESFRLYTYAKAGRAILGQPGGVAYQVFDATGSARLDHRYPTGARLETDSLASLADQMGVNKVGFLRTVAEFNEATVDNVADFTTLDRMSTRGLAQVKSNWAQPLEKAPFQAYAVACGITFTYGGVVTDEHARVLDGRGNPVRGLYAAGELQGGLFRRNYPGGAGLMRGAVFGKIAGAPD
jgi:tricarballylate dehydrogenase